MRGTTQGAELLWLVGGEAVDTSSPADPNVRNCAYAVVDGAV